MSYSDKAGLKLIKISLKGMSKQKLLGVMGICLNAKPEDKKESEEIINAIKNIWYERNYSLNELTDYIAMFKFDGD